MNETYKIEWDDDMEYVTLTLRNHLNEDGLSAAKVMTGALATALGVLDALIDHHYRTVDDHDEDYKANINAREMIDTILYDLIDRGGDEVHYAVVSMADSMYTIAKNGYNAQSEEN